MYTAESVAYSMDIGGQAQHGSRARHTFWSILQAIKEKGGVLTDPNTPGQDDEDDEDFLLEVEWNLCRL